MKQSFTSIDEYIAQFSPEVQEKLNSLRAIISTEAPDAIEAIAYGMPTFKMNGNLVHFAAFKDHIGFFPTPSGIDAYESELLPYRTGKGTLRFPFDRDIPYDLIKKIVSSRVIENSTK